MCPWPKDLSQHSHQINEDLCHQKYHFFTIQETEQGCDPGAAVCSVCAVLCSSCSCPRLRAAFPRITYSLHVPTVFLPISYSSGPVGQESGCVFPTWVFPPQLCSLLPPVCPCSQSHRHRRHPPLTRSPSMSSRPTRPSQQCPCPTLCSGHR